MLDGYITFSRVTGTVGQKISVTLFLSKIIIPGNRLMVTSRFKRQRIMLYFTPQSTKITLYFPCPYSTTSFVETSATMLCSLGSLKGNRNIIEFYSSQHGSMFTQFLCQCRVSIPKSPGTCCSFNHCPRLFCEFQ